jgi:hypothetical protein
MDDQAIVLLTEIRDLQRQQVQNSTTALERQGEALRRQADAIARNGRGQKILGLLVAVLILFYLLPIVGFSISWLTHGPGFHRSPFPT